MKKVMQKTRRFRLDARNPYRTRCMVYKLYISEDGAIIKIEQHDYVLKSMVSENSATLTVADIGIGKQLIIYMLHRLQRVDEAKDIVEQWKLGNITLVNEKNNILVEKALQKRFARNRKKFYL